MAEMREMVQRAKVKRIEISKQLINLHFVCWFCWLVISALDCFIINDAILVQLNFQTSYTFSYIIIYPHNYFIHFFIFIIYPISTFTFLTMDQILQNPKIILAALAGFLLPKLASYTLSQLNHLPIQQPQPQNFIGLELGGTNYNVAFGQPEFDNKAKVIGFKIVKQKSGRTSESAEETLSEIIRYIKDNINENEKSYFLGIASFGPLELDLKAPNHGSITSTPKPGWKNVPLKQYFQNHLPVSNVQVETDVNAAAFAEFQLGDHGVEESLAYITVGTGVGVGVVSHKKTIHGLTHPEGGHIIVNRHKEEYKQFNGCCPFHENCLEGLTNNKSIAKRLNKEYTKLHELDDSEIIWDIIGYYLAQLCLNITLTVSPEVIIIGGGVMNRKIVFKFLHQYFIKLLNKYIEHPLFTEQNIAHYIKPPSLGNSVGLKGAFLLKFL